MQENNLELTPDLAELLIALQSCTGGIFSEKEFGNLDQLNKRGLIDVKNINYHPDIRKYSTDLQVTDYGLQVSNKLCDSKNCVQKRTRSMPFAVNAKNSLEIAEYFEWESKIHKKNVGLDQAVMDLSIDEKDIIQSCYFLNPWPFASEVAKEGINGRKFSRKKARKNFDSLIKKGIAKLDEPEEGGGHRFNRKWYSLTDYGGRVADWMYVDEGMQDFAEYWSRVNPDLMINNSPESEIAKHLSAWMTPQMYIAHREAQNRISDLMDVAREAYKEWLKMSNIDTKNLPENERIELSSQFWNKTKLDELRKKVSKVNWYHILGKEWPKAEDITGNGFVIKGHADPFPNVFSASYDRQPDTGSFLSIKYGNCFDYAKLFNLMSKKLGLNVEPIRILVDMYGEKLDGKIKTHYANIIKIGSNQIIFDPILLKMNAKHKKFEKLSDFYDTDKHLPMIKSDKN